jgi:cholesterol oxidase
MAYRLAAASVDVCLLERGRPWPPGSFPRSPGAVTRNFWDPSQGMYGLYQPWSFHTIEALVSAGLGGGSLIYANVLLRKDENWFVEHEPAGWRWPINRADLDPYYDHAEAVLGGTPYPFNREPYASTPKTAAMREAADALRNAGTEDIRWELPPLAISFTPPGEDPHVGVPIPGGADNYHRAPRYTCRLIGECDLGCNLGAKNSLDYTYVTLAAKAGARIETLTEVKSLVPHPGGGYEIGFERHTPTDGAPADQRRPERMRARRVVLSAGTLGTTYLLLRNRASLPNLSPALGSRFSGNGDFLAFARECRPATSSGQRPRILSPSYGPVITSFIRLPDGFDPGEGAPPDAPGLYIEDAGWPEFANWLAQGLDTPEILWRASKWVMAAIRQHLEHNPDSDIVADLRALIGDGALTDATLGLLGMGRDVPNGQMRLGDDSRLEVDWSNTASELYLARVSAAMRRIAKILGGSYLEPPNYGWARRLITVHPLGGCPMGTDPTEGVVDPYGRVFGYPDLYVCDGSVMPGPVGANPSLTIAAFSERCAERIVSEEVRGGGG